jgi:6-phosphogluconolactonase (cycloisomerase 2 family)
MHFRRTRSFLSLPLLPLITLALAACSDVQQPSEPRVSSTPTLDRSGDATLSDRTGAVYTETNSTTGNSIVAFRRATDGSLTPLGTFSTGGLGIGGQVDPLQSQFAVVLSADHRALFAVNAGSNQVSSFRVSDDGSLSLASVVASGGAGPISLAVHDNLLYVLNTNDNTLSGFRITGGGRLVALPHTSRSLAAGANGAAAARFTPDGSRLIVSERVSNRLEVFPVDANGRLGDPVVSAGVGSATFGFDITSRNQPIVSETQGSVTSFALASSGNLTPITSSISTGGQAACWVIITSNGLFAYSSNAGTNTIAGFVIAENGSLTAITPAPTGNAGAGAGPLDLDQVDSRLLFVLEGARGTIGTFTIDNTGHLTARPDTPVGAPSSGFQGIAVY